MDYSTDPYLPSVLVGGSHFDNSFVIVDGYLCFPLDPQPPILDPWPITHSTCMSRWTLEFHYWKVRPWLPPRDRSAWLKSKICAATATAARTYMYVVLRNWHKLVPHPNPVHLMFHFKPLKLMFSTTRPTLFWGADSKVLLVYSGRKKMGKWLYLLSIFCTYTVLKFYTKWQLTTILFLMTM